MGVPAFFRWLSRKYPSIVVHCLEEKPKEVDGVLIPVDTSRPNPNDIEFDNLYLDMNGIIHPCCHPEDKPEPKNEDEMMILIFQYIDRIFSVVRPRRVLYMAIDGVAPRAKMNQQRSRRFRASKESYEKIKLMSEIREEMMSKGLYLPPVKPAEDKFDSNCITPGTPFMFRLAHCLRFYIHDRLNNDPGWRDIQVILSDANVPGEGEHKIMDFIRRQRAQPDHDPNTRHCLCGADADLIMLGLATHEANFTIIREEFKPNQPRPCDLCGQLGHEMKNCEGLAREKCGEHDEIAKPVGQETEFIFLRLNVLREYLERELKMDNLPFTYEFERALDDWVFMCFFVGNDFLPHLPSLEIREGAIDRLVKLYKNAVYKTGGYLTDSGVVALERVQLVMSELGHVEDEIFKKRREDEVNFKKRNKARKERERRQQQQRYQNQPGLLGPMPIGRGGFPVQNMRRQAYDMRVQQMSSSSRDQANMSAAEELKQVMQQTGGKGKDEESDEEPPDDVRLWEDGWKDRYYSQKFDIDSNDIAFRHNVANHYVRGLCWVLRYYYQGCASWKWYYPYHYAPFASDFVNIGDLPNDFERNTKPFRPLEQLMGVFPAASKKHIPPSWQTLMCDPNSPIIDFYPVNFKVDLNGKKYAWQGVALLPFVDEKRLHAALEQVYPDLTNEEKKRNIWGADRLFLSVNNPAYAFLEGLYEGGGPQDKEQGVLINTKYTQGMAGKVWCDPYRVETDGTVLSPLDALPDLHKNRTICVQFQDLQFEVGFLFKATLLAGAILPPKTLKPEDFNQNNPNQRYRPQLGFTPGSGYRHDKDVTAAVRMIRNTAGMQGQGFVMSSQSMMPSFAPARVLSGGPQQYGGRDHRPSGGARDQGSSSAGNLGWNRNMAGQQRAHQSNAGRQERDYDHYAGQGRSTSGGRDYNSRGSGYRPPPDRGYDTYRTGGPARPPGGYDSYRTGAPGPERGGYQGRPSDRQDEYQRYSDQRSSNPRPPANQYHDRYRPY
ncbi:5'-3' exoribonuclease 2-like [Pomacea canaliculata]|uniref:5'-3' exoribonuclease 2-like n=1 Tax=Pomacea canaliculata TaxID=400727 RepID=UPI000D7280D5|nr:5'-3' exoribonuclease 2-like [Pomacea canaliculata]